MGRNRISKGKFLDKLVPWSSNQFRSLSKSSVKISRSFSSLAKIFLILLVDYRNLANCHWCHNFGLPLSAASCPWTQEFFLLPWLALVSFLGDNTYDNLKNWFWRRKNLFLGEYVLSPRPSLRTHPFVKGMHQFFWVLGFGQEPAVLICVKRRWSVCCMTLTVSRSRLRRNTSTDIIRRGIRAGFG